MDIGGIALKRSGKQDLCQGPILSGMFFYALPLIATGVLQTLYNSADTAVIGRFAGDISLAAVTSTSHFINLLVNLFMGLSTGILTVVAKHIGAKHSDAVRKSVHTAVPLALICGIFLLVAGLISSKPVLVLMNTGGGNAEVLNKAVLYTRIYFLGTPAFLLYNFCASILRAAGDTKRPLVYLTISGVLNVLLNLLFVIVFHMDVAGVALATIISQYVSAVLVVLRLQKETGDIHFSFAAMRIDRRQMSEMLRIGVPSGIQSSMFSIANVVIRSTVNTFDYLYVAGVGAANQIENLMYTILTALYTATLAFTSQNFGAKNVDRIRKVLWRGHLLNILSYLVIVPLLLIFSRQLLGLFTTNPVSIEAGRTVMILLMGSVFIDGAMNVQVGHLRGLGYSFGPLINAMLGSCGLRIVWMIVIFPALGSTWEALYLCYPVTWAVTFAAHAVYTVFADRILNKIESPKDGNPASV